MRQLLILETHPLVNDPLGCNGVYNVLQADLLHV
jgi:hypothetical protein